MTITVSALACYPVKSLRGNAMTGLRFDDFGPQHDRRWMLVDASGKFITQRTYPQLCRVGVQVTQDGLVITADGCGNLAVYEPQTLASASQLQVQVWGDRVCALDAGEKAAAWFSDYLGTQARLCFMPESTVRQVDEHYARAGDRVGFADGFPVLLISEASLQLASESAGRSLEWIRFRPNIVVSGAEALAEEQWRRIAIGNIQFDVAKPCSRCVIPSIDPQTAQKQSAVVRGLLRFRRADGKVYFGQNLIHRGQGSIAVGDEVTVLS